MQDSPEADTVTIPQKHSSYRVLPHRTAPNPSVEPNHTESNRTMTEYLSGADAAKLLGCSETLIRKRIRSGELDAEKHRGKWRIRRDDLDRQERPNQTAPISTEPHRSAPKRTAPTSTKWNQTTPH